MRISLRKSFGRWVSRLAILAMLGSSLAAVPVSAAPAVDDGQLLAGPHVADQLVVGFKNDSRPFQVIQLAPGSDLAAAMRSLRGRSDVRFVEPNYLAEAFAAPNDPLYGYQWDMDNPAYGGIHAAAAWDLADGTGATVAIVDTGIAYENNGPYLQAPDLAGTCFLPGYDFVNNDAHPNDDNSHGTHVAGTVAQATNNGLGVAGLAHGACLMPVKVLDQAGSGSYANIAAGIRFAADNGANVINMSLGGRFSSAVMEEAVAYAYSKGLTIVAAAGNDHSRKASYPAGYDAYVISVGATRYDETLAPYSNFGPSVDVVAPGGDTSLDQNGDGYADGILQNTFDPNTQDTTSFGYWFFQGTSMASPHVAALAALLIGHGNAVSPDQVREAIQSSADDLGAAGRDNTYGWGLINAPAALAWTAPVVDDPPTVSLTAPLDGATLVGTVALTADAADDHGLAQVEFLVDGVSLSTDPAAPYEASWDTSLAAEGSHVISVVATDSIGQTASASATVTVDNLPDPPVTIDLTVGSHANHKWSFADLSWSGASVASVDVYRDGSLLTTTGNDGAYSDRLGSGGTYTYQVCEAGSSVCSNEASVTL